jgi:serine O-acetyltransferase
MNSLDFTHILTQAVDELSENESCKNLFHQHKDGHPLPSAKILHEIVELGRAILFPGYYGNPTVNSKTLKYNIGANIERLFDLLSEQILAGLCFGSGEGSACAESKRADASAFAAHFIGKMPEIRRTLAMDVEATYNGDPAAESYGEIICCYPVIKAISNYRMAHTLLKLGIPLIPRIMTELAHGETGIDIHPAAQIGHHFTIDHGTGVVIGETCVIGNNVKLYQGVTLGARSFPLDAEGKPIKGIVRHPVLEDNVIIYSNATILGRITIGDGAIVGGNIWVTEDVPAGARITQRKAKK